VHFSFSECDSVGYWFPKCLLTDVQREVEAGGCVAHVSVGGGVNGQQEVIDQPEQVQVWRRTQNLLDDFDKREADLLWDGGQVLIPMLL